MREIRILAVASAGGHLVQLRRLRRALNGFSVTWVTTDAAFETAICADAIEDGEPKPGFYTVIEGNRWSKIRLLFQMLSVLRIVLILRPHVVITTGASPGYFAIRISKLIGSCTIWVDSIANADALSYSGLMAGNHVSLLLTQWEHLAKPEVKSKLCPKYWGAVV